MNVFANAFDPADSEIFFLQRNEAKEGNNSYFSV